MTELSVEAQFWIVLNAILLISIIILSLRIIKRRRSKGRAHSPTPPLISWISTFDYLIGGGTASTAIITVFNKILDDLKNYLGLNLKRGLTPREFLFTVSRQLPEDVGRGLMRLYEIYEPIRFGGRAARWEDVEEFRKTLIKLDEEFMSWRAVDHGLDDLNNVDRGPHSGSQHAHTGI